MTAADRKQLRTVAIRVLVGIVGLGVIMGVWVFTVEVRLRVQPTCLRLGTLERLGGADSCPVDACLMFDERDSHQPVWRFYYPDTNCIARRNGVIP